MADASYVRSSFAGGLWGQHAQGRYHDPRYKTALTACLNSIPLETENIVRRPGFQFAGITRFGLPAKVVKFDFGAAVPPYSMEFTDGHIRFRSGAALANTQDSVAVVSISTANPAVMQTAAPVPWVTGDQVIFSYLNANAPILQNRQIYLQAIDPSHYALIDPFTGVPIDGSTIGPIGSPAVSRILDLATPYVAGAWSGLRFTQTDEAAFLLHGQFQPYAVTVTQPPTSATSAGFSVAPATFLDGPYLDPPTNGALLSSSAVTGVTSIALSFQAWVSLKVYSFGDLVSYSGNNYKSLVNHNVGNQPDSTSQWGLNNGNGAVNGGRGFLQTDVGRNIRLFSEPALWLGGATYNIGGIVSYNPNGLPGQTTYWSSLTAGNIGNVPGTDTKNWQLLALGGTSSPALWTWGRILSLVNFIPGTISGVSYIGNMTGGNGRSSAFNGIPDQDAAHSAANSTIIDGNTFRCYIGANYSATVATSYKIQSATIFPSTDTGMIQFDIVTAGGGNPVVPLLTMTARLFGSNVAPITAENGTLLGTTVVGANVPIGLSLAGQPLAQAAVISTAFAPVTIVSSDPTTSYAYVWVELQMDLGPTNYTGVYSVQVAQVKFVSASSAATNANGISVEILGPSLLYSSAIRTWRLGVYSDTTGWPSCGTYSDGRLWLAGAIKNRFDACVANGIASDLNGTKVNFAPTDQYGAVLESSGIAYTLNAPDKNEIVWMMPDLQGIIAGTPAGEWLIVAPSSGPIGPANIAARRVTKIGCASIEPTRTDHTTVFVQGLHRSIVEYFADVFSGKFTAPDIIENAKFLSQGNLQEIASQQELAPIIWARVNGTLIGCTYKRDALVTAQGPAMNAWHQHSHGGGRQIESICTGSSVNGNLDALMIVSNDPGTNIRFVEMLTDILDEGATFAQATYLDAAVTPTSSLAAPSSATLPYGGWTLNGLFHLNGKTVTAWLGGLDCGDYVVVNGSITVPYGDGVYPGAGTAGGLFTQDFVNTGIAANGIVMFTGIMPMRVGFTYTSQGQTVRPNETAESGARNGPALGKKRRNTYMMGLFEGSQGITLGSSLTGTMKPALFVKANGVAYAPNEPFSGVFRDQFPSDYDYDGMLAWRVTRPYICNMQAIGAALQTQDV